MLFLVCCLKDRKLLECIGRIEAEFKRKINRKHKHLNKLGTEVLEEKWLMIHTIVTYIMCLGVGGLELGLLASVTSSSTGLGYGIERLANLSLAMFINMYN